MASPALRQLLHRGDTVVAPGCHDALSAMTIEHLGFEMAYLGDSCVGSILGCSTPLLSLMEMAEAVSRIAVRLNIPLLVDAGPGYGGPAHVARATMEFEHAGAAGIHIEDRTYPRKQAAGAIRTRIEIEAAEVFEAKINAAIKARKDPNFVIMARTDAFVAVGGGKDEAVRRARRAFELGAEMLFIRDATDQESLTYFRKALPDVPLFAVSHNGAIPLNFYRELGYQLVVYPLMSLMVSFRAVLNVYRELQEEGFLSLGEETYREYSGGDLARVLNTRRWELLEE